MVENSSDETSRNMTKVYNRKRLNLFIVIQLI
jgi:hypothetical protein